MRAQPSLRADLREELLAQVRVRALVQEGSFFGKDGCVQCIVAYRSELQNAMLRRTFGLFFGLGFFGLGRGWF